MSENIPPTDPVVQPSAPAPVPQTPWAPAAPPTAPPPSGWAPPYGAPPMPTAPAPPNTWAPYGAPQPWGPPQPAPRRRRNVLLAVGGGLLALVVVALLVVGVTGDPGSNGEFNKSSDEVLRDAAAAYGRATSVHISCTSTLPNETDQYDLYLAPTGGLGSITANGAKADVIVVNGDVYLHGAAFFDKFGGAGTGAALGNRWVRIPAADPTLSAHFKIFTIAGISALLQRTAGAGGSFGKGRSTHEDGVLVLPLNGSDGALDVALNGTPYPIRFHYTDGDTSGDIHFGDYDKSFIPPSAPADSITVPMAPTS